ncbi:hypothetical protein KGF54_004117 [Candida jiufengensis]|uniref:uncharacterized protein n=1 Tax=Candida jiufengensis TaxID=497108 RepID=UPI0022240FBC|nr:uncharacterized protein KGF54_004117 [Candida jiufengensis]KAI5951043.1 hypothetical protein KGF54_004117 [Candida jiufengensis]
MAFTFGFTNDDLSDDDLESNTVTNDSNLQSKPTTTYKLDTYEVKSEHLPKLHDMNTLLKSLEGIRITFDNYTTPNQNIIYRRELFDVKHQIMIEDCDEKINSNLVVKDELKNIIIDKNDSDVQNNVYEGGFKSWECSYDTIDEINELINEYNNGNNDVLNIFNSSILDFGCGTALPSSYILMKKFEFKNTKPMKLILSDFNHDVLRLVTLPNLIINWASTLSIQDLHSLTTDEINTRFENNEVFVTKKLIDEFIKQLNEYYIEIKFISGSWGKEFNTLVSRFNINFMISSETIYSPITLPIVAESIKIILSESNPDDKSSMCLLAAKNIYFGVGGSIIEFLNHFKSIIDSNFKIEVKEINDSQLKRSLLLIQYNK